MLKTTVVLKMTKKIKLTESEKLKIRETLKPILAKGESQIVFEKVDGTIRFIRCTRDSDIIPSDLVESTDKKERKESTDSLPVWDTEIHGWRSFKLDSLVSINGTKVEHLLKLVQVKG